VLLLKIVVVPAIDVTVAEGTATNAVTALVITTRVRAVEVTTIVLAGHVISTTVFDVVLLIAHFVHVLEVVALGVDVI
jgi:hypothetical protein